MTADFDQLTNILQDFFERLPDNGTELLFREFLSSKASRWFLMCHASVMALYLDRLAPACVDHNNL